MGLMDVLKSEDYLILDTETTGVDALSEIVQLAIINAQGKTLMNELIRPVRPIPQGAIDIHGITNERVKEARLFPYNEVLNIINGKQVVVYNADFDRAMLYRSTKAVTENYFDWQRLATWHCVMLEFAKIYNQWDARRRSYRWQKLVTAAAFYNIPIVDAHDALGDCLTTLKVCEAMIGKTQPNGNTQEKLPF